MAAHIQKHNKGILNARNRAEDKCNCNKSNKPDCPLPGKCTISEVVYKAQVIEENGNSMDYYGLTELKFKDRYGGHKYSFKHEKARGETELSKHVWMLKSDNKSHKINWSIKTKAFAYRSGSKGCDLCLSEKTTIALADPSRTLNTRNEIISKCRHKRKFILARLLK